MTCIVNSKVSTSKCTLQVQNDFEMKPSQEILPKSKVRNDFYINQHAPETRIVINSTSQK